jgi:hypothetical protein
MRRRLDWPGSSPAAVRRTKPIRGAWIASRSLSKQPFLADQNKGSLGECLREDSAPSSLIPPKRIKPETIVIQRRCRKSEKIFFLGCLLNPCSTIDGIRRGSDCHSQSFHDGKQELGNNLGSLRARAVTQRLDAVLAQSMSVVWDRAVRFSLCRWCCSA